MSEEQSESPEEKSLMDSFPTASEVRAMANAAVRQDVINTAIKAIRSIVEQAGRVGERKASLNFEFWQTMNDSEKRRIARLLNPKGFSFTADSIFWS